MALQCRLWYFWWLMTVCLLVPFPMTDSLCTIPTSLQNGNWIYNTTTSSGPRSLELTVGTSKFSSGSVWINAQGTILNDFSCFSNLSLSSQETVVVMRSDISYTDFGDVRWVYMCMKLTEVTKDLYYLYLLSDIDNSVYPRQRIYSPATGINHLDTDPVCETFCTYNTQINNIDYSTLQKEGTSDSLPSGISFCPCNESCAAGATVVCDDVNSIDYTSNVTTGNEPGDMITYTCLSGYELTSGNLIRTCQFDKSWDGNPPVCSAVMCPGLASVTNSSNVQTGSSYKDTITYQCDDGFSLKSGDLTRTCQANKKWSGSEPECDPVSCQALSMVEHSLNTTTGSSFTDTIEFTCDTGYENVSGDLIRTCQSDGNWSGAPPVCNAVSCGNPPTVVHSTKTNTGISYTDTVTYTCDSGYEKTSGHLARICQSDKNWSGTSPVCSAVSCPTLATVAHSTKTSTGSHFTDTITYACDTGYELTSGDIHRTCQANKAWSGTAPVCNAVSCPILSSVTHSSNTNTGNTYSSTITYTCDIGYERTSGDLARTCQSDKTWSGTSPVCSAVSCPNLPIVAHSTRVNTGRSFSDTVEYTCNTGYERTSGDLTRTCLSDKTWSGVSPVCTIMCADPGTVNNVYRQLNGNNPSETIVYRCKTGYNLYDGDLTRTCLSNGQWSGKSPVCKAETPISNEQTNMIISATAAGAFFVLAIATIILASCLIYRRRKQQKKKKRRKQYR